MARAGWPVAPHGVVGVDDAGDRLVVVYEDSVSTRGEGKVRLPYAAACASHPGALYSHYLGDEPGVSYRLLKIGVRTFALRYVSDDDWRSNCGPEGTIDLRVLPDGLVRTLPEPVWAVDAVRSGSALLAVDWNLAPGVQGTGVLPHLSGFSVVGELERFWRVTGVRFWEAD